MLRDKWNAYQELPSEEKIRFKEAAAKPQVKAPKTKTAATPLKPLTAPPPPRVIVPKKPAVAPLQPDTIPEPASATAAAPASTLPAADSGTAAANTVAAGVKP